MNDPEINKTAASAKAASEEINTVTDTVAGNVTTPQDNVGLDVQSTQDFRSAASELDQSEQQRDAVFSETPQTQLHVANGSQNILQNTLQGSRELKSLNP